MDNKIRQLLSQALLKVQSGEWDAAHAIVQDIDQKIAYLIHAYLHRQEGDVSNANYWYKRANQQPFSGTLDQEYDVLNQLVNFRMGGQLAEKIQLPDDIDQPLPDEVIREFYK